MHRSQRRIHRSQRPVTRSFDFFFLRSAIEQTAEQTVETPVFWAPSHSLWRHIVMNSAGFYTHWNGQLNSPSLMRETAVVNLMLHEVTAKYKTYLQNPTKPAAFWFPPNSGISWRVNSIYIYVPDTHVYVCELLRTSSYCCAPTDTTIYIYIYLVKSIPSPHA